MRGIALVVALLPAGPASAQDGNPLSAIDWLSASVAPAAPAPRVIEEPPVADAAASPEITVTALDAGSDLAAALGAIDPAEVGLPDGLWARSEPETLLGLLNNLPADALPAVEDLVVSVLLARAEAPPGGEALALARVDRLLDRGDLAAAEALLRAGDLLDPAWFRRFFDVTLLRGTEDEACRMLGEHPALAPTLEARVFCLARNGDWPAAALTLNTARALGDVSPEDEALLSHFLDPEAAPAEPLGADRPSPLTYRIREAVGDLAPTASLPLAFSHADLRGTVAWRAQMEAAERLARRGALAPSALRDAYLARTPAASGGVWDRAEAVQALERALTEPDQSAVRDRFEEAWSRMGEAGLRAPLAQLYGPVLAARGVDGEAAAEAALLSDAYLDAAAGLEPATPGHALLRSVALGEPFEASPPDAQAAAVISGLADGAALAEPVALARDEGRTGEAILMAVDALADGMDGDHAALSSGLAALRALGLEETARRAGLEALLLPQP